MTRLSRLRSIAPLSLLLGCTGLPEGTEPVTGFELERYLGTWYEIARLDHRFERGLSHVAAHYSRRDDGGLDVTNTGYQDETGEWQTATGTAYFIGEADVGRLKVSFFGPFYSAYNIIELDEDYRYAMVTGWSRSYLWILARDPGLDRAIIERLVGRARQLGFATGELLYVEHGRIGPPPVP